MLKTILLLSVASLAVACSSQTVDDAAQGDEAEVNEGARYVLSADGAEKLSGTAKSGSPITIEYALDRLATCRGNENGAPGWNIYGYYSENGKAAKSFEVTKLTSDGKDREAKPATITPSEGGDLAIWFQVTSVFGCNDYDSDFGKNFHVQVQGQAPEALPTITFNETGAPTLKGELLAGKKVAIHYEPARLDTCEAFQGGFAQYGISGNAIINGNASSKKTFAAGRSEAGKYVPVDTVVDLSSAGTLELWFETTSTYGCHDFDSQSGANYKFEIK